MRTDPEPMDTAGHRQSERPVGKANADAVVSAAPYSLEVQRRVCWVRLYLRIVPVREGLNVSGQCVETLPKTF